MAGKKKSIAVEELPGYLALHVSFAHITPYKVAKVKLYVLGKTQNV